MPSYEEMVEGVKAEETIPSDQSPELSSNETSEDQKPTAQQLYEYPAVGKTVKEPLEMILKRASMGYDYSDKMQALKQREQELAQKEEDLSGLSRYKEFDDYAKQNPEWLNHWTQAFEKRTQPLTTYEDGNDENPYLQKIAGLEQKLSEYDSRFSKIDDFFKTQEYSKEEQAFNAEIDEVVKSYPDVDFSATNEEGRSLQNQILMHMQKNQIPNFRAGFRDFYHDQLVSKAQSKAKESVAKGIQKTNKAGILGVSSTPTSRGLSSNDFRGRSYDDLSELAKKELGL